jgi:hypothetical protein
MSVLPSMAGQLEHSIETAESAHPGPLRIIERRLKIFKREDCSL